MSKILIHSLVFSPDGVSTAYLYNDIALAFKNQGYDVVVLTTTPHYNITEEGIRKQPLVKRFLGLYYTSNFHGIKVIHIPQKKFKSTILRIIGFAYWHFASFFLGISQNNIDLILSPSPPITIGIINILIGKVKNAKVVYNVQEIYPDLLIENGLLRSKVLIYCLKSIERFVYKKSHHVTTIDSVFYNSIKGRFDNPDKLSVIPNFVDTDIYKPLQEDQSKTASIFKDQNSLKLMYAGNIGFAQDWEPLIQLAEELRNDNIEFLVIGEGVLKQHLEKEIEQRKLVKVHLIPYQTRELIPQFTANIDLQFIFMAPKTEDHGFPSKVYTIMACGKPLLVCSGEKTPIINFLSDKNCALLVTEKELDSKVIKLADLLRKTNRQQLRSLGLNGLSEVQKHYSKNTVTNQYLGLVKTLIP